MSGFLKNRKLVAALLCTLLLGITFGLGALAVYKGQSAFPVLPTNGSSSTPSTDPGSSLPDSGESPDGEEQGNGEDDPVVNTPVFFNRPSEAHAVTISAGVDYYKSETATPDQVKAEIDAALAQAETLGMNTVVFDLERAGKSVWLKSDLPTVTIEFDPLEYAVSGARQKGFYIYAVYDLLQIEEDGLIAAPTGIDATLKEAILRRLEAFVSGYDIDGVMLDGYYNPQTDRSYAQYMRAGGGIGFGDYMHLLPEDLFTAACDVIRGSAPQVQIGMMTEAVWANQAYNEEGSATNASFTTLYTGNVDNRSFVEDDYVDFLVVKALTADVDASVPFKAVTTWWGKVASDSEIPMYVLHAADKVDTSEYGWTEYDQLTKQLIALSNTPGWSGSIFNSLSRMAEDPKGSTTMVQKFFNDDINPKFVLTELAVTEPQQKTYTTFEQSVTFKGASDPYTDVTINGSKINTDQSGYFNLNLPLEEGLNKFTIVHKGRTEIFNITRQVQVLKEISPTGNVTIDGGMKVTITATAYKDAKVYAVVGGQTVAMSPVETERDESNKDSSYVLFEGYYTAPAATTAVQSVGNIVVYGEAQGRKEQEEGAFLKINKKAIIGDGSPIQVIADHAETFPTNVLNDYSDPDHFPLPKGTLDYSVGDEIVYKNGENTYSYYNLASGLRVYSKDIRAVSDSYAAGENTISGMTVEADDRYTKVIFKTKQAVSYSCKYDGSSFKITFNYTETTPSSMRLDKNPLFSAANWSGATLSLNLARSGSFLGFQSYYDSNNNLVFRFNNPPGGLSGAKIVIDPGHGGADPGASGFLPAYPEKVITKDIAAAVAAELRSRGATVVLLNTDTYPKTTLQQRVESSRSASPHLFISIHCNTAKSSSATGTEAYYFYGYSKTLAAYASSSVSQSLGTSNRGGKFGYYYVTRDSHCPSILLETGFLTNEREYKKLLDSSYQAEIASAVADASSQFLRSLGSSSATGTQSTGSTVSVGDSPEVEEPDNTYNEEADLRLKTHSLTLAEGDSETLGYTLTGSNSKLVWESDDESVVKVSSSGKVTAVGEGEATITVYAEDDDDLFDECDVTVEEGSSGGGAPRSISFPQDTYELSVGKSKTITLKLSPAGTNDAIDWYVEEVEGDKVVSYDEDGGISITIKGRNEGTVEIQAYSAQDDEVYAECVVLVSE